MDHNNSIVEDNINLLTQGINLIEEMGNCLYSNGKPPFLKNGVGSHFRHCIDFYNSFLSSFKTGKINYAIRKRNVLVETDGSLAIFEMESIIKGLRRLLPADLLRQVQVIVEDSSASVDSSVWGGSTVMRELQSLLSHTTHHYAIIALALRLHGFNPPEEFGVAKSTLSYLRKSA